MTACPAATADCDDYNLTTSIFVARGVLAGLPQARAIDPNIQALVTQYASYKGETSVLPGSAYLYQGEELGLHEVPDIPGAWSRTRSSAGHTARRRAAMAAGTNGQVLHFARPGGWRCVTNFGPGPALLPEGDVILTSVPAEGPSSPPTPPAG